MLLISEPDLAARVRTMTLLPGRVCHAIHQQAARQPESKFLNKVNDIKAALQRTVNKHPRGKASQTTIQRLSAKQILSNLNTIIGGLISLTVLKVVISPGDRLYFSRVDLRLFNCTPFAATLKELDLKVSVEDLPGILVPSTPHSSDPVIFPNLEILCLTLELEHKHSTEDPLTTGLLASFLNGCRRNLYTISLITGKALNPATGLLHQISQNGATFPSLTTLRLQQYYRTAVTDLSGLYSFLKAHHKFIRHLQLRLTVEVAAEIPSGAAFFAHPIFTQVALSSLEYLEMEFYHVPSDYLPSMVPFLNRCRPLRYLAIDCGRSRWSYANLEALAQGLQSTRPLGSLQHSVNSRGLRHLELTLEFFRADVLALLCKFLCHLEVLRLNFFTIEPVGYGLNLQGLRVPLVSSNFIHTTIYLFRATQIKFSFVASSKGQIYPNGLCIHSI